MEQRLKIPCSMYKCTKDVSRSEEEKYVEHGRKIRANSI